MDISTGKMDHRQNMGKKPEIAALMENNVALQRREMRTEHRLNLYRMMLLGVSSVMDMFNAAARHVFHREYIAMLAVALPIMFIYLFAIHRLTKGKIYRPWIKYFTITMDYMIIAALYLEMQKPPFSELFPVERILIMMISFIIILNMLSAFRFYPKVILYSTAVGVLMVVAATLDPVISFETKLWSGPIVLASGFLIYNLAIYLRDIYMDLYKREKLMRFLPKEVVNLVDSGLISMDLGGTEIKATILFADIRGFTSLSERYPAESIVALLNEYFSAMSSIIFAHQGMIDKYIGDAIMAIFGLPSPRSDDALRALETAVAMHKKLDELNDKWVAEGKERIKIGIALHTGVVVAGNIGSRERMDYTVIGDPVNITSRLESMNKEYHTKLLFSEQTRDALGMDIADTLIGNVPIRGRKNKVRIYTISDMERQFA